MNMNRFQRHNLCFLYLQLPYPMLGSLNGVAMFAQSHDVTLITTITKNCKLLWRDYHNRLGNFWTLWDILANSYLIR